MQIDLNGPDGNAFALMGYASRLSKQLGNDATKTNSILNEMRSGDYNNLLNVFEREFGAYVTLTKGHEV